jgi:hypothetical protein
VPAKEEWKVVSFGSLHALYALKTSVSHVSLDESVDAVHPHTFLGDASQGYVLPASFDKIDVVSTYDFF